MTIWIQVVSIFFGTIQVTSAGNSIGSLGGLRCATTVAPRIQSTITDSLSL